mgnify:CR=1 FL=1
MIDAEDGDITLLAKRQPAPKSPSREEVGRHNLTHLPYRSWCPHCVAARRPNTAHRTSKKRDGRNLPLFVADYFFVRKPDEDLLTGLAGKLYPSGNFFASVCDVKGPEDPVTERIAEFLKSSGVSKLVYKADQETAIRATFEKALAAIGANLWELMSSHKLFRNRMLLERARAMEGLKGLSKASRI